MQTRTYDELMMRVEDDLHAEGLTPVILDNMPLKEKSGLAGVVTLKGTTAYIFLDKNLETFEKAQTLVEEYFHVMFDLGNMLDYDENIRHQNNELMARENVISYMTEPKDLNRLAREYEGQQMAPWMLMEQFGYPADFADETLSYYRRRGYV